MAAQLDPDPLQATKDVNKWVEERTHGRVKNIVPPEAPFVPDTAVVLVNALYFKGEWLFEFDEHDTVDDQFVKADGETVMVPMMNRDELDARVLENDLFQAIEMKYKFGGSFAMTAFLPREGHSTQDIIQQLDGDAWSEWRKEMASNKGDLAFPKFKVEYNEDLAKTLQALGMERPFNSGQFDRMVPGGDLDIGRVLHKTFLEINEKGTEASGATLVETWDSASAEPFQITFNRPFLVVIHGTEDDTILFIGKIADPTA